jgi:hypothetical protein
LKLRSQCVQMPTAGTGPATSSLSGCAGTLFRGYSFLLEFLLLDALHQFLSLTIFEALEVFRAGLHERSLPHARLVLQARGMEEPRSFRRWLPSTC